MPRFSTFLISFSNSSFSTPKTANITPSSLGVEVCIAFPLSCIRNTASSKEIEPAHTKAVYSPKEWPAKNFASSKFKLNSFFKTSNIENPTVIIAG